MSGELPVVAVVGAGNIGCALAAELGLRGAEVRLFNRSPGRLNPIREAGGITATGALEGTTEVALLTSSLAEAVADAEVVAVTVPAPALPEYARPLGEVVTGDQVLWLDPGHSGGALYLAAEIERATGRRDLKLCQLTTATHGARMAGPATVRVFALSRPGLAAFPPAHLAECLARVGELLAGRVDSLGTVLEADLLNLNALLHPPGMVCNAGWIEATAGGFRFYAEGAGVSTGRVIDAVDAERLALAERLGAPTVAFSQLLHRMGFTTAEAARSGRAHDALAGAVQIHAIPAPATLDHRYLHEDVGWGLVPWSQLAAAAGIPTPVMSALIALAGTVNGLDYLRTGLTLERMGLGGMTAEQMRAHVGGA